MIFRVLFNINFTSHKECLMGQMQGEPLKISKLFCMHFQGVARSVQEGLIRINTSMYACLSVGFISRLSKKGIMFAQHYARAQQRGFLSLRTIAASAALSLSISCFILKTMILQSKYINIKRISVLSTAKDFFNIFIGLLNLIPFFTLEFK